MVRKKILETAKSYLEQKEVKGNKGFIDKHFQEKMEAVGWQKGQAWCSYFAELVWIEGYGKSNSLFISELTKLFSANAISTFNQLVSNGFDSNEVPEPGDLVVWMSVSKGQPKKIGKWTLGHIGIVSDITEKGFKSIEGNSNNTGSREGIKVVEKQRGMAWKVYNGLQLVGFVKPKKVKLRT